MDIVEPDLNRLMPTLSHADQQMAKPRVAHVQGFVTGFDTETEEEKAKRHVRAARFGIVAPPAPEIDPMLQLEVRQARAERFGVPLTEVVALTSMLARALAPRRDPAAGDARREDAVHVYGDLSNVFNGEVMALFQPFGPKYTEWLDDSSVNVVFEDQFSASRALAQLGKALPESAELDALGKLGWRYAEAQDHAHKPTPLLLRVAAVTDVKSSVDEHRTMRRGRRGQTKPASGSKRTRDDASAEHDEAADASVEPTSKRMLRDDVDADDDDDL